jgi:hypothetical protein
MNSSHDFRLGFIDLLLCSLVSVVVLFIMTTLLVNPVKKVVQEGVKKNAEYIIQADWNPNIDCDVDLWVRNPNGIVVYFKLKDADLMNLERDDFGTRNDSTTVNGKVVISQSNTEVVTLRGFIPGAYTVNVHAYGCIFEAKSLDVGAPIDVPVKVTLIRLNPTYEVIREQDVVLKRVFDEETAFTFQMSSDGQASNFDDTPKNLVVVKKQERN